MSVFQWRKEAKKRCCPKASGSLPLPSMTVERFLLLLEEKEMPVAETLKRRLLPMFHRIPLSSMTRDILAGHSVTRLKWPWIPKEKESHAMLNPIDRVCNSVQRLSKVHLRIHPENIQKYLDELVYKAEIYDDKAYSNYMHHIDISIFFSRISFRRQDIQGIQQH